MVTVTGASATDDLNQRETGFKIPSNFNLSMVEHSIIPSACQADDQAQNLQQEGDS